MELTPGTPVRIEMTKWGARPHWVYPGRYLGVDEHGTWIGFEVGTHFVRPGAEYVSSYAQVALVPPEDADERGWVACLHGPESVKTRVYVDVTSPPQRDGAVWHAVDLDLDVVQRVTGHTFVDDEDEFAEHQVLHNYPPEIIRAAEASAAAVYAKVVGALAPYDGATHTRWLSVLADLPPRD